MIAHGDFQSLDIFLNKRSQRYKEHEDESGPFYSRAEDVLLEVYLFQLFDIVREVLRLYILNPEDIDTLKKN
ncbi:hypothetical protein LBK6_11555 [Leptospira borgpetersenii serovar Hardjo]|nr:hypothetical protein LBK6_11555 [Leptospira borgpetersenii serovar Hardjo]AWV70734.1 hypothetical protein B9T54_12475 [Leptospira borgpetersenii serovar Hardjo-bovis]MBE8364508.1 hypothetical protein [Leptospira borgpetersenii serovar Balcanica]TQE50764.1 hypothetical protein FFZ95_17385 [Leptospira borgpetersenii]AMX62203.1 hypothetical protein LBK9_11605 [Leptospira borgpetersenii serovar Hardjo]